jgi:hypothetical protein
LPGGVVAKTNAYKGGGGERGKSEREKKERAAVFLFFLFNLMTSTADRQSRKKTRAEIVTSQHHVHVMIIQK